MSSDVLGKAIQIGGGIVAFTPIGWKLKAAIVIGSHLFGGYLRGRGPMPERQERGVLLNVRSNQASIPVVYGRTKVGAQIIDVRVDTASENDEDLYVVATLCVGSEDGTGIELLENVYLDDRLAIAGPLFELEPSFTGVTPAFRFDSVNKLVYGLHRGSDAQTVDAGLDGAFADYGTNEAGRGIAYIACKMIYQPEIYPHGIPQISAVVKGQRVYDPRTDTWAWSSNPALCILDYLTSKRYGAGALYAERDGGTRSEIDEQSFIDAANYCEEQVSTPAGTQDRFTCNGRLDTGRPIMQNLMDLCTSCRGELVYQGGKFRLVIRRPTVAEPFELTADDTIGEIEYWRGGVEEVPNRVVAHFVDEDGEWMPQEATWPEPGQANGFLTADAAFENVAEIRLPFTVGYYRAQQIGMVFLREQREDTGVALNAREEAVKYQVGSVIKLTHPRAGFDQSEFWVRAMGLNPDNTIRLVLGEYDVDAYSLDAQNTRDTLPASELPDVFDVAEPTNVAALSDDSTAVEVETDVWQPRVKLSWTRAPDPFLTYYEVQIRETAGPGVWRPAAPDPLRDDVQVFLTEQVTKGVSYDIRIRAVNRTGVPSDWVQISHTVGTRGALHIGASITPIPAVDTGTRGVWIDLDYDVGPDVDELVIEYAYLDDLATPSTFSYALTGLAGTAGRHRIQNVGDFLFQEDYSAFSVTVVPVGLPGVVSGPPTVIATPTSGGVPGRTLSLSLEDPAETGSGTRVALTGGGAALSDMLVPGVNVTTDVDANGRPRINASGAAVAELDDVGDVTITAVGDGEVIQRSSGAWINRTLAEAGIAAAGHTHAAGDITSGTFAVARIPSLPASQITSGAFDDARIPALDASKITTGTFDSARIPALDAAKITTGVFDVARIPDLAASKITPGTFGGSGQYTFPARIRTNTSGTSASPSWLLNAINIGLYRTSTAIGVSWQDADVWTFNQGGDFNSPGDVVSSASDRRLKEIVGPLLGALDRVRRLEGVVFYWNDLGRQVLRREGMDVGLIAQDVLEVLPQAVRPAPANREYLTVRYERVVPLLVEAVKELTARFDNLEGQLLA